MGGETGYRLAPGETPACRRGRPYRPDLIGTGTGVITRHFLLSEYGQIGFGVVVSGYMRRPDVFKPTDITVVNAWLAELSHSENPRVARQANLVLKVTQPADEIVTEAFATPADEVPPEIRK